jgi:GNAT superfamily N-acetyltransferase
LVGVALAAPSELDGVDRLVALGVAPEWRRGGLATAMLRAIVADSARGGRALVALHTVADRDPMDPLPRAVRRGVAERLARAAGMTMGPAPRRISAIDPDARLAVSIPPGAPAGLPERIEEWLAAL